MIQKFLSRQPLIRKFLSRQPWRQLGHRRSVFESNRANFHLSDADFIKAIAADGELEIRKKIILILRELIAARCDIDPAQLDPRDRLVELEQLMGPHADFVSFMLVIPYRYDYVEFYYSFCAAIASLTGTYPTSILRDVKSIQIFSDPKCPEKTESRQLGEWLMDASLELVSEIRKKSTLAYNKLNGE